MSDEPYYVMSNTMSDDDEAARAHLADAADQMLRRAASMHASAVALKRKSAMVEQATLLLSGPEIRHLRDALVGDGTVKLVAHNSSKGWQA